MLKKVFFLTGELSGEMHAAAVVRELLRREPELQIAALGGDLLRELGVNIQIDYRDYNFSGLTEVLFNIFKIFALKKRVIEAIEEFSPDVLVLVDYAGFNLEIAKNVKENYQKRLRKHKLNPELNPEPKQIKIIEYIAAQIWASRPHRIKKIKANVDKVLCTLPFEQALYENASVPVRFVGNPVLSSLPESISKSEFLEEYAASISKEKSRAEILIGLFPGSRKFEISYMLPLMLESARSLKSTLEEQLGANAPKLSFVLARASSISLECLDRHGLAEARRTGLIEVLDSSMMQSSNHKLLSAADILWLCSGTVTLEAALYGTPHFIAYKGNWINFQAYKMVKIIDMIGLPNIIANKYIVKEFLQKTATVTNFVAETLAFLDLAALRSGSEVIFSEYHKELAKELLNLKELLNSCVTHEIVADEILAMT